VLSGIREQRHIARALYGTRDHTLVLGAGAHLTAGLHLAAVTDVATHPLHVLVVQHVSVPDAEFAATATESATASAASATRTVVGVAIAVIAIIAITPVTTIAAVVSTLGRSTIPRPLGRRLCSDRRRRSRALRRCRIRGRGFVRHVICLLCSLLLNGRR
jgi:hypothetical protein